MNVEAMVADALSEIPDTLRTERVFAVCRIWYQQHGTLPTMSKLRELVGKGSYTDLGRDMKAFKSTIKEQTERTIRQPGMPPEVEAIFNDGVRQLWLAVSERAEERFEADRLAIQTQYEQIAGQNEILVAERMQALQERSHAFEALACEKRKVSELEAIVLAKDKRISDLETSFLETTKSKDLEITKLQSDLLAANRLVDAKDIAVAQLREQVAGLQEQVRSERELTEGFRIKAGNADNLLASTKARLDLAEQDNKRLKELVADKDRQIAEVKAALVSNTEHFREKLSAADLTNAILRGQIEELRRQVCDLEAARSTQAVRIAELEAKIAATPKSA